MYHRATPKKHGRLMRYNREAQVKMTMLSKVNAAVYHVPLVYYYSSQALNVASLHQLIQQKGREYDVNELELAF